MRAASYPLLALPLLLTYCGAKQDLVLGEVAAVTDAGTAGVAVSGTGAEPALGGSAGGGTGGAGGSVSEGGTGDSGASEGGSTSVAGAPNDECEDGEDAPVESLIHRYNFDGTGNTVDDTIAAQNGQVIGGAMLNGSGILSLPGGSPPTQWVNLPDHLFNTLTDVTVVTWVTWSGGAGYQRIFDFGISDAGVGQGGQGKAYFAMMPTTGFESGQSQGLGAEIKAPNFDTVQLASKADINDLYVQAALVFRGGVEASLYLNGELLDREATPITLQNIDDVNNWLGLSQWKKDHGYQGSYDEVRVYDTALNSCQLKTLILRGADRPFL